MTFTVARHALTRTGSLPGLHHSDFIVEEAGAALELLPWNYYLGKKFIEFII